jgi:hypothetical protein
MAPSISGDSELRGGGRKRDNRRGQPLEEILAEAAVADRARQIIACTGNQPSRHLVRVVASDRNSRSFIQGTEESFLSCCIQLAHVGKEERAVVCELQSTRPSGYRVPERASFVTPNLAFEEYRRTGRGVDAYETSVRVWSRRVDQPRKRRELVVDLTDQQDAVEPIGDRQQRGGRQTRGSHGEPSIRPRSLTLSKRPD